MSMLASDWLSGPIHISHRSTPLGVPISYTSNHVDNNEHSRRELRKVLKPRVHGTAGCATGRVVH